MYPVLRFLLALLIPAAAIAGIGASFGVGTPGKSVVSVISNGPPASCTSTPLTCPLVGQSDNIFTFLGSFKAPPSFIYGGSSMAVSGTTLYMNGLYSSNIGYVSAEGSMTIPTLTGSPAYDGSNGTATAIVAPTTHVDGSNNPLIDWGGGTNTGGPGLGNQFMGALVYSGTLYLTGGIVFDATGAATKFIVPVGTNLSNASWGTPNGVSSTSGSYVRFFSGVMGVVPSQWTSLLGGPAYIANGAGESITTKGPAGFSFSTFDPTTVNAGGGTVTVTELQDYYWQGTAMQTEPEQLSYRSFTGPMGSGANLTLSSAPTHGATTATLSSPLCLPLPFETQGTPYTARYRVTFSDSEYRDVSLTNCAGGTGSANIPDGVSDTSFSALTGSTFTTAVNIKAFGDRWFSVYDGPLAYGFFVPGSRTFIYISIHQYGPLATSGTSPCDIGAAPSGNNEAPISPDTTAYRTLQITAYDVLDIYHAKNGVASDTNCPNPTGTVGVYAACPYAQWDFPNWQNIVEAGRPTNCIQWIAGQGYFFYDPSTSILYGTTYVSGGISGTNIIYEWKVNSLALLLLAWVRRRRVANDATFAVAS